MRRRNCAFFRGRLRSQADLKIASENRNIEPSATQIFAVPRATHFLLPVASIDSIDGPWKPTALVHFSFLCALGLRPLFVTPKIWLHTNLLVLNPCLVCSLLRIFV